MIGTIEAYESYYNCCSSVTLNELSQLDSDDSDSVFENVRCRDKCVSQKILHTKRHFDRTLRNDILYENYIELGGEEGR